jgi:hypothetical protein
MSLVALLNESIQHICAALVTQCLVTVWSIFHISQTEIFRRNFVRLTVNGACSGMNLLGDYWTRRKVAEILGAVLNGIGLLVIAVLTYKLVKVCHVTYSQTGTFTFDYTDIWMANFQACWRFSHDQSDL